MAERFRLISLNLSQNEEVAAAKGSGIVLIVHTFYESRNARATTNANELRGHSCVTCEERDGSLRLSRSGLLRGRDKRPSQWYKRSNDFDGDAQMDERSTQQPLMRNEKRRGSRFPVVVFVEAKWQTPGGESLKETAQALEVSALGGLLDMKTYPKVGSDVELTNLLSGEAAKARVVGTRLSKGSAVLRVAVELLTPSETFWGLNFQLRKTSAELLKIEQQIKSGGVDPRILEEFRDSVDYVRKTAWAVQEWQERQLQKHDPRTLLPLITSERIRRGTQLTLAIAADLTAHEVTEDTPGMRELFRAIENLYVNVKNLLRGGKT